MREDKTNGFSRTGIKTSLWILAALVAGFLFSFFTMFMTLFSSSALRHGGLL